MYKQAILVRQDLKMDKGKMAVQVAHASVDAALKSDKKKVQEWRDEGMKKIVMKVPDQKSLIKYMQMAKDIGLKTALITDAAKTFFKKPTTTALAIGPDLEEEIDKVTGSLKIL